MNQQVTRDVDKVACDHSGEVEVMPDHFFIDAKGMVRRSTPGNCVCAKCYSPLPLIEQRKFAVYGTGHPILEEVGTFIGTALMHSGMLVWHVFEVQRR